MILFKQEFGKSFKMFNAENGSDKLCMNDKNVQPNIFKTCFR